MKDKIEQIIAVGDRVVVLTTANRVLSKSPKGQWKEITPPKELMELEDIPRFWFGKSKGEPIAEATPKYLDWCRSNIEGFYYIIVDGKAIEDLPF